MAIFNSYVKLPEGIPIDYLETFEKDPGLCWTRSTETFDFFLRETRLRHHGDEPFESISAFTYGFTAYVSWCIIL